MYSFSKSLPLILTPLDPLTNVNQDVKEESEVPVLREEEEKEASSLEFNHKKNPPLHFNRREKSPQKVPLQCFFQNEKRDRGIENVADLKPLCLPLSFPSCLFFFHRGGQQGALLGGFPQLYLLLDDSS